MSDPIQKQPRFFALFDCSPADAPDWVKRACQEVGLFWVDNDAVATVMSKDPEAQKAMREQGFRENPALAPHYSAALEKLSAGHDRLAVYSVSWFLYGVRPAVAILDFQPLEEEVQKARASGKKIPEDTLKKYVQDYRAKLNDLALTHVGKERTLVVTPGQPAEEKAQAAAAHIKKFLPPPPSADPAMKFKVGVKG
jgi:hypothetical protein